jgi:hypothetical protein
MEPNRPNQVTCPTCGVTIEDNALVLFSSGPAGTRARLWARVCQFVKDPSKKEDCINQNDELIGDVVPLDYYN